MPKTSNMDYRFIFRDLNICIWESRISLLKNSPRQTTEMTELPSAAAITAPAATPAGKLFEFSTHILELFFFSCFPLEK